VSVGKDLVIDKTKLFRSSGQMICIGHEDGKGIEWREEKDRRFHSV
jgi:hypothetical protein